jgi:hypothetical protein
MFRLVYKSIAITAVLAAFQATFGACKKFQSLKSTSSLRTAQEEVWGMKDYSVACFEELGELPEEIRCDDASEIKMTADGKDIAEALVAAASSSGKSTVQCDNPIMSVRDKVLGGCIPGTAVKRITKGEVDFTFICRRRNTNLHTARADVGGQSTKLYDTVAFIGHNRSTNRACFVERTNDVPVSVPGQSEPYLAAAGNKGTDYVPPLLAAGDERLEAAAKQWEPMSIDCTTCHSTQPYVISPAISALTQASDSGRLEQVVKVLPRLKRDNESGALMEAPYTLVAEANLREYIPTKKYVTEPHPSYGHDTVPDRLKILGKPRVLDTTEARACAKCHDIGGRDYLRVLVPQISGRFPESLVGDASSWDSFSQYAGRRMGSPYIDGEPRALAQNGHHDDKVWRSVLGPKNDSAEARARLLDSLVACGVNANAAGCTWTPEDSVPR